VPLPADLPPLLDALEARYGPQTPPRLDGPLEQILWENVGYLVDDERRREAFAALKRKVGTDAADILAASDAVLREVADLGGMLPEARVAKLRRISGIALKRFGGDVGPVLGEPVPRAKAALTAFPGIGEPGAEKILLFSGTRPLLALESNGLRALLRLGYGDERKSYAATYRSVQAAAEAGLPETCPARVRAHLLLRRHGQELCRRSRPRCDLCPLAASCDHARGPRPVR